MNRLLIFSFILIFNSWSKSSFAQQIELDTKEVISKWELRALYFNFNFGPQFSDQHIYSNLGMKFYYGHGWGLSLGFSGYTTRREDAPLNYKWPLLSFRRSPPGDITETYGIRIMREFQTSEEIIKFGFEAGAEHVVTRDAKFVRKDPCSARSTGRNYDVIRHARYGLGGVFVAKLEFRLGKNVGFDAELFTHLNKYHSTAGLSFGICIGMVGK